MKPEIYAFLQVLIMAGVTALIRFIPFIIWGGDKKTPKFIEYLSKVLPAAVMGMLVIFCLKGISFEALNNWAPAILASGIVVVLHVWKRETLLSILGGTIVYMLLIQFM